MNDLSTLLMIIGVALCVASCLDRLIATKTVFIMVWARHLSASKMTNGKAFCAVGFEGTHGLRGIVRVPQEQYQQMNEGQPFKVSYRLSSLFKVKFNFLFESL
jgi:hypothetical protein